MGLGSRAPMQERRMRDARNTVTMGSQRICENWQILAFVSRPPYLGMAEKAGIHMGLL